MLRQDFYYDLPANLIAQTPTTERSASRMLVVDGERRRFEDSTFKNLPGFLAPGDLLVFNNTRVIPARLRGSKLSGGKIEVLVERLLPENRALAFVRASKPPKAGMVLTLGEDIQCEITGRHEDLFELRLLGDRSFLACLEQQGEVPLPPYIERAADEQDTMRYQTIFAQTPGAVAAPTAGLHFDETAMRALSERGVEFAYITLHVGAGTFKPMRVDRLEDHQMHHEYIEVSEAVCEKICATQTAGKRVIAVGTTTVRALESAAQQGRLQPFSGETNIFIYPGFRFRVVDGLVTNFHLPESTLLMLVCAYAGYETIMAAYRHAVAASYRFFSYGDAMLVWPTLSAREKSEV